VAPPPLISMFKDMKINRNMLLNMDIIVTCTFFSWPLPFSDTDMDMDIVTDIDMNEHLHVYELEYEKVHVHVNVMFPVKFHHSGRAKRFLGTHKFTDPKLLPHKPCRSKTV